jgi:hypothetical protein
MIVYASNEDLLVVACSVFNGKMFLSLDISNHVVRSFLNGRTPPKTRESLASLTLSKPNLRNAANPIYPRSKWACLWVLVIPSRSQVRTNT